MIYTPKIQKAIQFATKTHEVYQKQKRKGKDIPYITHPLIVGLILSHAGATEDVIVAGILHDTIEDSVEHKKVTSDMIKEDFGENVANLVSSVTEKNRDLPWEDRKRAALEDINSFSNDSILLKSADVISNVSELVDDYTDNGEVTFDRFNAPKEKIIDHYLKLINFILTKWPSNPLNEDLNLIKTSLQSMLNG